MNYGINLELKQAVDGFNWNGELNQDLQIDIDDLVNEVSLSIISTSQSKTAFEQKVGRPLTLLEACYLVVQEKGVPEIIKRIQEASNDEKAVLNQIFVKLSENFVQVDKNNLKAMTLLFGVKRVHELVSKKSVPFTLALEPIEKIEVALNHLMLLRSHYNPDLFTNETDKQFLENIDKEIKEKQELILRYQQQNLLNQVNLVRKDVA